MDINILYCFYGRNNIQLRHEENKEHKVLYLYHKPVILYIRE